MPVSEISTSLHSSGDTSEHTTVSANHLQGQVLKTFPQVLQHYAILKQNFDNQEWPIAPIQDTK